MEKGEGAVGDGERERKGGEGDETLIEGEEEGRGGKK